MIDTDTYDHGIHCGQTILITDTRTGKTLSAMVADMCPGCDGPGSIDLSKGLFDGFASEGDGYFPGEFWGLPWGNVCFAFELIWTWV